MISTGDGDEHPGSAVPLSPEHSSTEAGHQASLTRLERRLASTSAPQARGRKRSDAVHLRRAQASIVAWGAQFSINARHAAVTATRRSRWSSTSAGNDRSVPFPREKHDAIDRGSNDQPARSSPTFCFSNCSFQRRRCLSHSGCGRRRRSSLFRSLGPVEIHDLRHRHRRTRHWLMTEMQSARSFL